MLSSGVLGSDSELSDFRRVSDKNAALSLPLGRVHISDKKKRFIKLEIICSKWFLMVLLEEPLTIELAYDETQLSVNRL